MNLYDYIKVVIIWIFSLVIFAILLPLFFIVAITIVVDSKGPILFTQKRIGKNGKIFTIYKFRTMKDGAELLTKNEYLDEKNPLITRIGSALRKTSLDELPQLLNILKGNMTLIGPRPLMIDFPYKYEDYPPQYIKRFDILPGIFCLIDIEQRATASIDEQFNSDIYYLNHSNLFLDIKIFFGVLINIIKRKNIYRK